MSTQEEVRQVESTGARRTARDWRDAYAGRLGLTDFLVIVAVVATAQIVWFGFETKQVQLPEQTASLAVSYWVVSVLLVLAWTILLQVTGTRSDRVIGTGSQEYRSVVSATLWLFGMLAIVAFMLQVDFSRGYFVIALPLGTIALVLSRWLWRKWLNRQRTQGRYSALVLLVGSEQSALHTANELTRHPYAGYRVVGACIPRHRAGEFLPGTTIPVIGDVDRVQGAIEETGADTVVITSSDALNPARIRELSWSLEPGRQHLVVAPSLTDIGGPRIHTRPVAGLPLIHVETPRYEGFKAYQKRIFDVMASAALLFALSPVLLVIAAMVRLTSPGGVLFRQERIGHNGKPFHMLKFRSMVTDAEEQLHALQERQREEGNAVLFKMKYDPRVTPIGRILRRYSLDELPQLINVLRGDMSLIGPRPPLQREVEQYENHVHRRFLMKPGITGLWQVSGRSDLSWEDSVRLDLYYVENWSMVGDFVILMKTARAVFGSGAY